MRVLGQGQARGRHGHGAWAPESPRPGENPSPAYSSLGRPGLTGGTEDRGLGGQHAAGVREQDTLWLCLSPSRTALLTLGSAVLPTPTRAACTGLHGGRGGATEPTALFAGHRSGYRDSGGDLGAEGGDTARPPQVLRAAWAPEPNTETTQWNEAHHVSHGKLHKNSIAHETAKLRSQPLLPWRGQSGLHKLSGRWQL